MIEHASSEIPTFTLRRGSVRCRVLLAVSTDRAAPTSIEEIAVKLPTVAKDHISVELTALTQKRAIERVARGRYVRLVGETFEFRG